MKPLNHTIVDLICSGEYDKAKMLVNEYIQQVKNQLHEEAIEQLMEIDWNAPDIVKNALDADIQCGFESEGIWVNYESAEGEELEFDLFEILDNHPEIRDEYEGSIRSHRYYKDAYRNAMNEYRINWVSDNVKNSDLQDEYRIDNDINDDQEIDRDKFIEWLGVHFDDYIQDKYERLADEEAIMETEEEISIEDWINDEYDGVYGLMDSFGIEPPSEGDLPKIAWEVEQWVEENSKFKEVSFGSYHSGSGQTDVWRVEDDGSLIAYEESGYGAGVEVISPAYDDPQEMLEELEKWLTFMKNNNVKTYEDVGLHVTMSMSEKKLSEPNRVKMAVLLDDEYLLKEFGRELNQYTPSQQRALKSKIKDIENGDKKSIEDLEKILEPAILNRRAAINFKKTKMGTGDQLNEFGNQMIEFRIMGNQDYETKFKEIKDAIIRYSTVMQAGYNEDSYRKNYLTKLARLIDKAASADLSNDQTSIFKDDLTGILTQKELNLLCKLNNSGKDFTSDRNILNKFAKHYNLDPKQDQDEIKSKVLNDFGAEIGQYCQERQKIEMFEQLLNELKIYTGLERIKDFLKRKDYIGALNQIVTDVRTGENKAQPNARTQRIMRLALKKLNITTQDLIKHASHWGVFQEPKTGQQYADALSRLLGTEIKTPEPQSIKKFRSQSGYALVKGSVLQPLLNPGEPIQYYDDGLAIDLTDTDIIGKIGKLTRDLQPHEWSSSPEVKELSKKLGVPIAYPDKTIYPGEQFNSDLYYLITQGRGKLVDLLFKVGIDI